MNPRAGRVWALTWAALVALTPWPVFGGQEAVEIGFRGEVRPEWEVVPERRVIRVVRGEIFDSAIKISNKSGREVMAMVLTEVSPPDGQGYLIHLGCGPSLTVILKPGEAAAVPGSYFVTETTPPGVAGFEVAYSVYSFEVLGPDPLRVGKEIYALRCANCHGVTGRGDGSMARLLPGGVRDLAPALRAKGDREILTAIEGGVGPMPAFAPALSESEQRALLPYLRNLPAEGRAGRGQ